MNQRIYVHHSFNDSLFIKLFHNTTNRSFLRTYDGETVLCKYKELELEIIFNKELNDNEDGLHLVDWFTGFKTIPEDDNYKPDKDYEGKHDFMMWSAFGRLLENKSNWIISAFRTEKLSSMGDVSSKNTFYDKSHEPILGKLLSNHKIICDNKVLRGVEYNNLHYCFTNMMYEWDSIISIRWFREFKQIYDNLNHKYNIGFSMRNPKPWRIRLMKRLSQIDSDKFFLQITDGISIKDKNGNVNEANELVEHHPNIHLNSLYSKNDWDNLSTLSWHGGIDYDFFFRYLSKAKMYINDESWGGMRKLQNVQYLSEKTIGLLLSGIPFIPTNSYALEILEMELDTNPHPLIDRIKLIQGREDDIRDLIVEILNDFDKHYEECKKWSDDVYNIVNNKMNNENSFLDLILSNWKRDKEFNKSLL